MTSSIQALAFYLIQSQSILNSCSFFLPSTSKHVKTPFTSPGEACQLRGGRRSAELPGRKIGEAFATHSRKLDEVFHFWVTSIKEMDVKGTFFSSFEALDPSEDTLVLHLLASRSWQVRHDCSSRTCWNASQRCHWLQA